ncbi:ABC transporter ATP-binding protein [Micromonospora phytophila]|uniref:ABC transporter ATP-binding protein n=1 Tax=Micromonospora phytophila TaxID=709888 RepID=UPI00202F1851|nr:ABC transporter ATP-binding protein [Micromonospora phytophila]MCM0676615.1 ABC transporter ATP-binding protein [Micromonospora phytophila]
MSAEDLVPPVIELAAVHRTYPGPPEVTALHPTNLTVRRGDYLVVVGPSGSGKSTLLNLLGLLDRPTGGSYRLDGVDVSGLPERDRTALRGGRIGFVFQAFHLLPHRTALENVMLAQIYNGTPRSARRAAARAALSQVGLDHRTHALPTTLSGGERQRVAVARALVTAPALLLCDEPTGNLDSTTARRLLELFDSLHAAGLTIVMITHSAEVARRAQRIVTISDGMLREGGRAEPAPAGAPT